MTTPDTQAAKWAAYAIGARRHVRICASSCTHFLEALQLPLKLSEKAEGEKTENRSKRRNGR